MWQQQWRRNQKYKAKGFTFLLATASLYLFKTNGYGLGWNMHKTFAGIFHTQIIIVVTNYFIYKRIFWCCSSVNTRFCVDDTLTAAGRSVSKTNTFRPVWVQYQHTIIFCYHGRKNLAEQTTQLFEVKVTSVASDGYVFEATDECTLQDLAFLGLPFQFRRQCHRINYYFLLWGRGELGFNKLCSKLQSIIGLEGDRPYSSYLSLSLRNNSRCFNPR